MISQETYMYGVSEPVRSIVQDALSTVDATYSATGDPRTDAAAELYLPYHNGRHTRFVCADVRLLKDVVGLTPYEYEVALSAGVTHDVFQELDAAAGENENKSAVWLVEQMQRFPQHFTEVAIHSGKLAVLGTGYSYDQVMGGGRIIRQHYKDQSYPTKRAELMATVVGSADMGRIHSSEGPLQAHQLLRERICGASAAVPKISDVLDFQSGQVQFLDAFSFDNPDIQAVLGAKKSEVVGYAAHLLGEIEKGNVTTWQEVIAKDVQFMASNLG